MKWIHFLQINLIDECFTQWGSQDCRWPVFGLELQGTDGKAAALMCFNRSTGLRLLVDFSSDIFFFSDCALLNHLRSFQKLFPSFLYHTFFPLLILPLLSCWLQVSVSKKHRQSLAVIAKQLSYRKMLEGRKGIGRNVPSRPLFEGLWVLGSTRRACREWLSSCAFPNQHLLLPLLETEFWARGTTELTL